ncbi:MAG TPA: 30S ribosomal protein S14 [Rickettsiales bacterium]|nr:30S ribosomal protein S14 [Rickettsiales bacterium]
MAKVSAINKNNKRKIMVANQKASREALKSLANDKTKSFEERFNAMVKLSEKPRNSSKVRIKNRCSLTGRPRAYHGFFGVSRVMLRELASSGLIPGLKKSSW